MSFYSTLKSLLNERIFEMTFFSSHMHIRKNAGKVKSLFVIIAPL